MFLISLECSSSYSLTEFHEIKIKMSKNCDYIAVSNNLSAEHTFRTFNDPLCLSQNKLFLLSI